MLSEILKLWLDKIILKFFSDQSDVEFMTLAVTFWYESIHSLHAKGLFCSGNILIKKNYENNLLWTM